MFFNFKWYNQKLKWSLTTKQEIIKNNILMDFLISLTT